MVLMEASAICKDVNVTQGPKNNNHFGCYNKRYEKKVKKIISFVPLGAHKEANGLMYKVYYYPNRV